MRRKKKKCSESVTEKNSISILCRCQNRWKNLSPGRYRMLLTRQWRKVKVQGKYVIDRNGFWCFFFVQFHQFWMTSIECHAWLMWTKNWSLSKNWFIRLDSVKFRLMEKDHFERWHQINFGTEITIHFNASSPNFTFLFRSFGRYLLPDSRLCRHESSWYILQSIRCKRRQTKKKRRKKRE